MYDNSEKHRQVLSTIFITDESFDSSKIIAQYFWVRGSEYLQMDNLYLHSQYFLAFSKNGSILRVFDSCTKTLGEENFFSRLKPNLWPIYVSHSTSMAFLLIILGLFIGIKKLRKNPLRKYWIVFCVLSIVNYVGILVLVSIDEKFKFRSPKLFDATVIVLAFLEFTIYFWLLTICVETFLMLKWVQKSISRHFKPFIYLLVFSFRQYVEEYQIRRFVGYMMIICAMAAIYFSILKFVFHKHFSFLAFFSFLQRTEPDLAYDYFAVNHMKYVGVVEISIKGLSLLTFSITLSIIRCSRKAVEALGAQVHTKKPTRLRR